MVLDGKRQPEDIRYMCDQDSGPNGIHPPYDKPREVSPSPNPHLNISNSIYMKS